MCWTWKKEEGGRRDEEEGGTSKEGRGGRRTGRKEDGEEGGTRRLKKWKMKKLLKDASLASLGLVDTIVGLMGLVELCGDEISWRSKTTTLTVLRFKDHFAKTFRGLSSKGYSIEIVRYDHGYVIVSRHFSPRSLTRAYLRAPAFIIINVHMRIRVHAHTHRHIHTHTHTDTHTHTNTQVSSDGRIRGANSPSVCLSISMSNHGSYVRPSVRPSSLRFWAPWSDSSIWFRRYFAFTPSSTMIMIF